MIDAAVQRTNMIDSQIRPSDVTDRRIVRAMQDVARDKFVPEALQSLAYSDGNVALGLKDRVLLAPRTFAKLLQLASIEPTETVLIVGGGMGYSAAVAGRLAGRVLSLEDDATLAARAKQLLADVPNVTFARGPLPAGDPAGAAFDVILIEGSVTDVPAKLLSQLSEHGRLVAILRDGLGSRAAVWRRTGASISVAAAFDAEAPLLPGFANPPPFQL